MKHIEPFYILCGLLATLVGLGIARDDGWVLVAVVVLISILMVIVNSWVKEWRASREQTLKPGLPYFVGHPDAQEIESIVTLGKKILEKEHVGAGENHVDTETLKRRFSINPRIIWCLYDDSSRRKLIGYYILYPLTKEALSRIIEGKILNGKDIKDNFICKSFDNAAALYVGMVGGLGFHAEGYVMQALLNTLQNKIPNKKLKAIFTRGATISGKKAMADYNFTPLSSTSEIRVLFNNEEILKHPRILRHVQG